MAGLMTRVNYVSDDALTYRIREDASNAAAVGNVAATVTNDLPKRYFPRHILCAHPVTGRERKIAVGDPANPRWIGTTATITLPDFDAAMAATVYLIRGRIGERRLG